MNMALRLVDVLAFASDCLYQMLRKGVAFFRFFLGEQLNIQDSEDSAQSEDQKSSITKLRTLS